MGGREGARCVEDAGEGRAITISKPDETVQRFRRSGRQAKVGKLLSAARQGRRRQTSRLGPASSSAARAASRHTYLAL